MNNLLVQSGTASQAFGCVSMTKTKPITALYQCQMSGTGVGLTGLNTYPYAA
jgi:hypothetical protein